MMSTQDGNAYKAEADDLGVSVGVLIGRRDIFHFMEGLVNSECACTFERECGPCYALRRVKPLCYKATD